MIAFAGFVWSVTRLTRFLLAGRPERRFDRIGRRIWDVVVYFFGQRKVAEERASWHHLIIYWGFLVICVGTLELILGGLSGEKWSLAFVGQAPYHFLKGFIDVSNCAVLLVILYSYFRRVVLKPPLIPLTLDAGLILGMIGLLMVTHFGYHGFKFAHGGGESFMPISYWVAQRAQGVDAATAATWAEIMWWAHVAVLLTFLNYIPYSKHIHLLGSGPNIFFRNLGQRGALRKLNLEDENDFGVSEYEKLTWKSLLDGYACTECARCTNNCPAWATEKPLSPMQIIHDVKDEMKLVGAIKLEIKRLEAAGAKNGELGELKTRLEEKAPFVGGRVKDEVLWACTTCGACQQVCPVFIDHPEKIIQMRQHLVLSESRMPAELARTFQNLERNSNPWGMGSDKRFDWAEGIENVPVMADKGKAEWLYFIGCAGCFDDRVKKTTQTMVQILNAAGVDYAVLGLEEGCCGDPARRAGNEFLFQMEAEANVEVFKQYDVKKIVTACPHCLHVLKNEYPAMGGSYEVIHHSQLLLDLVEKGRVAIDQRFAPSLTYHDPCYLGRWNGQYDTPRALLERMSRDGVRELGHRRERSFCCGAGGGRMFLEEKAPRVNRRRTDEILAAGVEAAAVACPFCTIMVTDGTKDADVEDKLKVLELSEILWRTMKTPAAKEDGAAAPAAGADTPA
ncbi:MAG TPA: (Fe-S)-binding protein [Polyangia bacterium]